MNEMIDFYLLELYEQEEYIEEFVGLTIIALVAIYKKYLSKAAKACKDKESHEKGQCIVTYQIAGKKAQLQYLKKMAAECSQSKNKDKCLEQVKNRADKIQASITKLIEKHKKVTAKMNKKLVKMKG